MYIIIMISITFDEVKLILIYKQNLILSNQDQYFQKKVPQLVLKAKTYTTTLTYQQLQTLEDKYTTNRGFLPSYQCRGRSMHLLNGGPNTVFGQGENYLYHFYYFHRSSWKSTNILIFLREDTFPILLLNIEAIGLSQFLYLYEHLYLYSVNCPLSLLFQNLVLKN